MSSSSIERINAELLAIHSESDVSKESAPGDLTERTLDLESAGWFTKEYSLKEMSCMSMNANLPL